MMRFPDHQITQSPDHPISWRLSFVSPTLLLVSWAQWFCVRHDLQLHELDAICRFRRERAPTACSDRNPISDAQRT